MSVSMFSHNALSEVFISANGTTNQQLFADRPADLGLLAEFQDPLVVPAVVKVLESPSRFSSPVFESA
jgi:hypothetical protein